MARGKKGVDGVDKVVDLFPAGSHKMIERLLARAAERDAKAAERGVKKAMRSAGSSTRSAGRAMSDLARELGKAMRQRGDLGSGKASIRQKAPSTGGRPFHFAHSVVSKEEGAPQASGKAAKAAAGAAASAKGGKTGRAAAHMRYIEREIAVERTYGESRSVDGPEAERGTVRAADRGRDDGSWERELAPEAARAVHATGATAGQGYIENPVKLANGERIVFSFGTIGDRFEDRVRFWEALEEAEAHPSARVQHRLIVELPHEATPEARHEMVRTFARRFERDGVPYWATLHAPGRDNDSRNFHAHIVYSERPSRRMADPAAPGSAEVWDFEVTRTYKTSSRHTRTSRPFRQEKLRDYHARDFIPRIRKEFNDVVNAVLERDDVRDAVGAKVRYDHRSYKAMGVDAVPMRSINRIVADKVRDGKLTVLDGDYTRRMIAAELREAASKRQKGVMELIALDDALRATAEGSRPQDANARLPRGLRVSPLARVGKASLRKAGRGILEARHAALQVDVMERATLASLVRIVAATAPRAVEAAGRRRDPVLKAEAPSAEAARLLHAAALDEMRETRASTERARRTLRYRVGKAVNEWRELVGAPPPTVKPAMRIALAQADAAARPSREAEERGGEATVEQPYPQGGARAQPASGDPTRGPATADLPTTSPMRGRATNTIGSGATLSQSQGERRAPTLAQAQSASSAVSGWIKAIMNAAPDDVEQRLAMLGALVESIRPSRTIGDAAGPAAVVETQTRGGAADRPAKVGRAIDGTAEGVATSANPTPVAPEENVARAAGIGDATPRVRAAATGSVDPRSIGTVVPAGASTATDHQSFDKPEERADDERRRREREEETEKRKRKRRAVLSRSNRGRDR